MLRRVGGEHKQKEKPRIIAILGSRFEAPRRFWLVRLDVAFLSHNTVPTMPKRKRSKGLARKAGKRARMASHIMSKKAASMDDVIANLGISLLAVDWTPVELAALMHFIQHNTAKVADMVQDMPDSPPDPFQDVPKPIWRAFCAGHERVSYAFPPEEANTSVAQAEEEHIEEHENVADVAQAEEEDIEEHEAVANVAQAEGDAIEEHENVEEASSREKFKRWIKQMKEAADEKWKDKSVQQFNELFGKPEFVFQGLWGQGNAGLGSQGHAGTRVSLDQYSHKMTAAMGRMNRRQLLDLDTDGIKRFKRTGRRLNVAISEHGEQREEDLDSTSSETCEAVPSASASSSAASSMSRAPVRIDAVCRSIADILANHVSVCGQNCNTDHLNPCTHATEVLQVMQSFRREHSRPVFPSPEATCVGNAWILNSVFPLFTPSMGKYGLDVLASEWNVKPLGSRTPIHLSTVQSVLDKFFLHRPALGNFGNYFENIVAATPGMIGGEYEDVLDRLGEISKNGIWFRMPLKESALMETEAPMSKKTKGAERAWHGFKMESLASMLKFGLQESSPDKIGSQHQGTSCLYCCSDNFVTKASGYCNSVPGQDGLYWSGMWELVVDRRQGITAKPKRRCQWLQPRPSYARRALWILVVNFEDVPKGQGIQAIWEPLFECPMPC